VEGPSRNVPRKNLGTGLLWEAFTWAYLPAPSSTNTLVFVSQSWHPPASLQIHEGGPLLAPWLIPAPLQPATVILYCYPSQPVQQASTLWTQEYTSPPPYKNNQRLHTDALTSIGHALIHP
jgi:hypothetical protein